MRKGLATLLVCTITLVSPLLWANPEPSRTCPWLFTRASAEILHSVSDLDHDLIRKLMREDFEAIIPYSEAARILLARHDVHFSMNAPPDDWGIQILPGESSYLNRVANYLQKNHGIRLVISPPTLFASGSLASLDHRSATLTVHLKDAFEVLLGGRLNHVFRHEITHVLDGSWLNKNRPSLFQGFRLYESSYPSIYLRNQKRGYQNMVSYSELSAYTTQIFDLARSFRPGYLLPPNYLLARSSVMKDVLRKAESAFQELMKASEFALDPRNIERYRTKTITKHWGGKQKNLTVAELEKDSHIYWVPLFYTEKSWTRDEIQKILRIRYNLTHELSINLLGRLAELDRLIREYSKVTGRTQELENLIYQEGVAMRQDLLAAESEFLSEISKFGPH